MNLLILLFFKKNKYSNLVEMKFFRNKTNNPKFNKIQSQINCTSPKDLCEKYQNLVVNCSFGKYNPVNPMLICNGIDMEFRHGLEYFILNCEDWDNISRDSNEKYLDKNFIVEDSCYVDIWLDKDIIYTNNFTSTWFFVIIGFIIFVFLIGFITILSWINDDISFVEYSKKKID